MQIEHTTTEVRHLVKTYTLTGLSEEDLQALIYVIDQCEDARQHEEAIESIYSALEDALSSH